MALVLLGVGASRLALDPQAPYRLAPDHPTVRATQALVTGTGGDDLVLVALHDPRGVLRPEGVAAIEAVRASMAAEPSLDGVRAVTNAPLLAIRLGVLTAETPLLPTPTGDAEARVRADPFVVGPLLGVDGTVAVIPGWIRRPELDAALLGVATTALRDAAVRAAPQGAAAQQAINDARLAVVLGQTPGPPEVAAAAALRALAANESGGDLVKGWARDATRWSAEPDAEALAAAQRAVGAAPLPAGVVATVLGAPAVAVEVAAAFPIGVALLVLGLACAAGLGIGFARRQPWGGMWVGLAVAGASGATFGAMGWLGLPLHGMTALAGVAAGAIAALLATGAHAPGPRMLLATLPIAGLGAAMSGVEGAQGAWAVAMVVGLATGAAVWRGPEAASPRPRAVPGRATLAMAGVVAVLSAVSLGRPMGVDPGRMLDSRHPLGRASALLADQTGLAAPGQLVLTGAASRSMAAPEALRRLRRAQDVLESRPEVLTTISWADFVASLHSVVGGAAPGALPEDPALVDQYLLLFGRPDATRPLVSRDLTVASGLVRLRPGHGAALAELADALVDHDVALGGRAVEITVAARRSVRWGLIGAVVAAGLALLLGLALRSTAARDAGVAVAASLAAVAGASWWAGALSLEALVAGGLVLGAGLSGGSASVALLGGAVALGSPVVAVAALGLGLGAGGVVLLSLQSPRAPGAVLPALILLAGCPPEPIAEAPPLPFGDEPTARPPRIGRDWVIGRADGSPVPDGFPLRLSELRLDCLSGPDPALDNEDPAAEATMRWSIALSVAGWASVTDPARAFLWDGGAETADGAHALVWTGRSPMDHDARRSSEEPFGFDRWTQEIPVFEDAAAAGAAGGITVPCVNANGALEVARHDAMVCALDARDLQTRRCWHCGDHLGEPSSTGGDTVGQVSITGVPGLGPLSVSDSVDCAYGTATAEAG